MEIGKIFTNHNWKVLIISCFVRAEGNYEDTQWVSDDHRYRREALIRHAKVIRRCSFCLQDDHDHPACPRNPHCPLPEWLLQMDAWPTPFPPQQAGPQPTATPASRVLYRRFNEGRCCKQQLCKYPHRCFACNKPHPQIQCRNHPPAGCCHSHWQRGSSLPGQANNRYQH